MVGLFSRLGSRAGHRSQASVQLASARKWVAGPSDRPIDPDEKEATNSGKDVPPSPADIHGVEPTEEFKPVEHPLEPPDKDQPIKCPPPEPSILNDGRIWKERLEASVRRRAELPIIRETGMQSQRLYRRRRAVSGEHLIVPSFSAPEHTILKFLDDQAAL